MKATWVQLIALITSLKFVFVQLVLYYRNIIDAGHLNEPFFLYMNKALHKFIQNAAHSRLRYIDIIFCRISENFRGEKLQRC